MNWNTNIEEAPRGHLETRTVTRKNSESTYEEHVTERLILATKCGKVTTSYWIPKEERWCMLSKNEEPYAWMPWPEHPAKGGTK